MILAKSDEHFFFSSLFLFIYLILFVFFSFLINDAFCQIADTCLLPDCFSDLIFVKEKPRKSGWMGSFFKF